MDRNRKRRKPAFLRFEIEAMRELPRRLSWFDWAWITIELFVAIMIVISCNR